MGGLPWDVAARDLPVPEAISQRRAALGIPQATPRAQEAPPQAAKRGQGQACGDGQTAPDTQDQSTKTSKSVYNIISTQGWVGATHRTQAYVCWWVAPALPRTAEPALGRCLEGYWGAIEPGAAVWAVLEIRAFES